MSSATITAVGCQPQVSAHVSRFLCNHLGYLRGVKSSKERNVEYGNIYLQKPLRIEYGELHTCEQRTDVRLYVNPCYSRSISQSRPRPTRFPALRPYIGETGAQPFGQLLIRCLLFNHHASGISMSMYTWICQTCETPQAPSLRPCPSALDTYMGTCSRRGQHHANTLPSQQRGPCSRWCSAMVQCALKGWIPNREPSFGLCAHLILVIELGRPRGAQVRGVG